MIKGFFFDLDGTLVDTHQANFLAYGQALQDIGVTLNYADFKKTIGVSAKTFLPQLAPGRSPEEYEQIAAQKAAFYKKSIQNSTLNHELFDFVKRIKGAGCTVALVTTAKRKNVRTVLKHHKLVGLFDFIVAQEDVVDLKPSPEAFHKALELSKLKPDEVIALEDSESGVCAARAAGIPVITIKDFQL